MLNLEKLKVDCSETSWGTEQSGKSGSDSIHSITLSVDDRILLDQVSVPLPKAEPKRLVTLRQCNILDTPPEELYDRYTAFASRYFNVSSNLIRFLFQLHNLSRFNY